MLIDLTTDEIHLWLAFYHEMIDERLLASYHALLDGAEKERMSRFYFAKDRRRYLIAHGLLRTVLSRCAPVRPEDWTFATNAYGRPEATRREATDIGLAFNISHTDGLIVLAVSARRALGVDVENVRAREISMDIADRFFAPDEVAALAAVPPKRQQDRFFEYWTFKESYIKARGMGLSLPLDKFSFRLSSDRAVTLAVDPSLGDDASRWQFWQLRPRPEYLVAVCAERINRQVPRLAVRKVVPAGSDEMLATESMRTSQ
jgi:4'-phosphopantetheinyl transferase